MTYFDQSFKMFAGDTKRVNFQIEGLGDLMGVQIVWGVRDNCHSKVNFILKTTNDDITINNLDVTINLKPSDTVNLEGDFYHECELTDIYGNVSTIFVGDMKIIRSEVSADV